MIDSDQLVRDLRVFADPATPYKSELGQSKLLVELVRDGDRKYSFDLKSGAIVSLNDGGRKYSSLAALLASEDFADIRRLRANQRRILTQRFEEKGGRRAQLEPEGAFLSREGNESPLNKRLLEQALIASSNDKLGVLLLDGPAGIGKTSLIENVSFARSAPDSVGPPLLHVVSSGGRLTDLPKALAHSLQSIRAQVTFDQVPVLARLGVIQVAIDGFDELVDPDGYKDAWSALREFLSDVATGGPIILSGRDTFFDQQSFERLLADRISNLDIVQARLAPVSPSAARDYLAEHGWSKTDLDHAQQDGWFKPGSYHLRPFFLNQISGEDGWRELQMAHGSPQSFLVKRMVRREADIVAKTVGVTTNSAEKGLWEFFGTIAEDMSIQQAESVDEDFVAFACEAAFASYVSPQDLKKLVHKASSFALLEVGDSWGTRRFPHTEFQNQFAARAVVRLVKASTASSPFMRQAVVSVGFGEAFSDVVMQLDSVTASLVYENLMSMLTKEGYSERLSSNIASLLIASLNRPDLSELSLSSVNVSEARVIGVARKAKLQGVTFGQLDLSDANCSEIMFSECAAYSLTVDSLTSLREVDLKVTQLRRARDGKIEILRSPEEIAEELKRLMAVGNEGDSDLPLVKYLDRLCRTFMRQHQIRDHDDEEAVHLLRDERWPIVRDILGSRIVKEAKFVGGPRSSFYRMIAPENLLRPLSDEDKDLRGAIIERARNIANT